MSGHCAGDDILTPSSVLQGLNYHGRFNVLSDTYLLFKNRNVDKIYQSLIKNNLKYFLKKQKYFGHIPSILVKNRAKDIWDTYFKFTIDRNPWDKTISHFYWVKKNKSEKFTFHQYMKEGNYCLNFPLYTESSNSKVLVDEIMKYENLEGDFSSVLQRLNIPFDNLSKENAKTRSNKSDYKKFFSGENEIYIDKISEIFKHEINLLDYSF
ncbi:MAG: hypothetical protein HKN08_02430 [Gammaproteobacteria bacterium]|nr:hypothetical protein [Gammaproteobacteria bacterium]